MQLMKAALALALFVAIAAASNASDSNYANSSSMASAAANAPNSSNSSNYTNYTPATPAPGMAAATANTSNSTNPNYAPRAPGYIASAKLFGYQVVPAGIGFSVENFTCGGGVGHAIVSYDEPAAFFTLDDFQGARVCTRDDI